MPPGSAAITLGRLIIVRRGAADDERLMRHELVHVRQWRELGVPRFLVQYLGAYFRGRWHGHGHHEAYRRIPLEVQAEREAACGKAAEEGLAIPAAVDVTDPPPLESGPPGG